MKRSRINSLIKESTAMFDRMNFMLPAWANWEPGEWKGKGGVASEVVENMLGWDLTDFGSGDFDKKGLILFTLRNGNPARDSKIYAEKIMIVGEEQETPMHFHWVKMEDIINRGGGNLVIDIYGSTPDERFSDKPVDLKIDGVLRTVEPGGRVVLTPGESIALEPRVYHRFFGEKGKGKVLVGEVSSVNDDSADNRFHEPAGRFPEIDEDEAPFRLLAVDYPKYL